MCRFHTRSLSSCWATSLLTSLPTIVYAPRRLSSIVRHREDDFDFFHCLSYIFPHVTCVLYILFTDHPKQATLAGCVHTPARRVAVIAHPQPLDCCRPNHSFDHQVQVQILDIPRIQMKDAVKNIASYSAFDPGQVIPCNAILLLGG